MFWKRASMRLGVELLAMWDCWGKAWCCGGEVGGVEFEFLEKRGSWRLARLSMGGDGKKESVRVDFRTLLDEHAQNTRQHTCHHQIALYGSGHPHAPLSPFSYIYLCHHHSMQGLVCSLSRLLRLTP